MPTMRLTLLRHAKSDWNDTSLDDFDRPLNARGQHDVPRMGSRLHARGLHPQLILSSPALRAITTARKIAPSLDCNPEAIVTDTGLYLATPAHILKILANHGTGYHDVLLVGHNPGLTELANRISDRRIDNIPTCGAFCIEADVATWAELGTQGGRLAWFDYPKNPDALRASGKISDC